MREIGVWGSGDPNAARLLDEERVGSAPYCLIVSFLRNDDLLSRSFGPEKDCS